MKLSVIVPCYNSEEFIRNSLGSILDNLIDKMEIILVNDGSEDNTLEILKEYQNKYPNEIRIINQKNQGLSMARNNGLNIAKGEYVAFIDSDDTIEQGMFKSMLEKAKEKEYDLVVCGVNMVYPDHSITVNIGIDKDCDTKKAIKNIMTTIYPTAWNKLYKRSSIGKLRFKKDIWYEDVEFLYRLLPNISSIGVVKENYYNYIQREGSMTYTYNEKLFDLISNVNGIVEYYKENKIYKKYYDELEYTYVRYLYATLIKRLAKMKNKEKFDLGVKRVIESVKTNFPNYKKNKYFSKSIKGIYLKHFNKFIADIVYYTERNQKN